MFAIALILCWIISLSCASGSAGYTDFPPRLKWHPAYWVAEGVCLRQITPACTFGFILFIVGGILGSVAGLPGELFGVFLLAPLPHLIIDFTRRDTELRSKDFYFFNPFKPISEKPTTITSGGRQEEVFQEAYFYISDKDWSELVQKMDANEVTFLKGKWQVSGIYLSDITPEFMHLFDSLNLSRFLVHPENKQAMESIIEELRASSRPAIAPQGQTARGVTPPPPYHSDEPPLREPDDYTYTEPPPDREPADDLFQIAEEHREAPVPTPAHEPDRENQPAHAEQHPQTEQRQETLLVDATNVMGVTKKSLGSTNDMRKSEAGVHTANIDELGPIGDFPLDE
jgi:hypothetical protein